MQRPSRAAPSVRAAAVGIALLGHGLLLLLVILERRAPRREEKPALQLVDIWLQPLQPASKNPVESSSRTPPPSRTQPASRPARAIPLPALPQGAESTTTLISQPPAPVDWNAAASSAAARSVEASSKPATFSPPPKSTPEPCVPREFDKETEQLMADRLPPPEDPPEVGPDPQRNCLVVGGRPMCVQKITVALGGSASVGDLFDDMQNGKTPPSSVPTPRFCD